ncbi:MAG: NAD(P)/FAD-dependent oxidoreductase [Ilumatobacter sp.]|uniref:phytoene desaturase family protein n=1 Tax=Ilumatobacter sp. TaxID=1967498 RepID=UPI003C777B34
MQNHDVRREDVDAIIVGAGHNGLVTAAYLAKAGWNVVVLERNDDVGGAVRSAEVTEPGYVHDLYAMNQNLFIGSKAYEDFRDDLERHGLEYCISDKPFCNVYPDGSSRKVYSDLDRTVAGIREHSDADADGFLRLGDEYERLSRSLLPLYDTPLPSLAAARAIARALRTEGVADVVGLARLVLHSTRELGEAYFETEEMRAVIATWGMHMDFGPDVSAGAQFPLVEVYSNMANGMAVPKGGASAMPRALVGIIEEHGGVVRTGAEVERVLTTGGEATGVRLTSGEEITASKAVVANLTPNVLFERLLPEEPLPEKFRRDVADYTYGPGTMMIHLALSGQPRWSAGDDIADFAYVHVAPYVADLAQTYTSALNGELPAEPLLVVGQPTVVDPSRTPDDGHILWIQVRALPFDVKRDAAGEIEPGSWDDMKEAYADRVMAKLEKYAPGVGALVTNRVVESPLDLQRSNPNLHHGDSVAGSLHLRQNFLFRPFLGWSTYEMPVEHLHMIGAATWPGGGTNGGSGQLVADQLLGSGIRERATGWLSGVIGRS